MADLTNELERIRTAVLGFDVRDAIYDAIEKMNNQLNSYISDGTGVIGVKGSTENAYRDGLVNISASQVGALPAEDYASVIEGHTESISEQSNDIFEIQSRLNYLENISARLDNRVSALESIEEDTEEESE